MTVNVFKLSLKYSLNLQMISTSLLNNTTFWFLMDLAILDCLPLRLRVDCQNTLLKWSGWLSQNFRTSPPCLQPECSVLDYARNDRCAMCLVNAAHFMVVTAQLLRLDRSVVSFKQQHLRYQEIPREDVAPGTSV